MRVNLKQPPLNASSDRELLAQTRSYLFQLVAELQWAFDNIDQEAQNSLSELNKLRSEVNGLKKKISSLETKIDSLTSEARTNITEEI